MKLLDRIPGDLQSSTRGRVVYVEGRTDIEVLHALLGIAPPVPYDVEGVRIFPLGGSDTVRRHVAAAADAGIAGVIGILDGDGRDFDVVDAEFRGAGPVYSWPAYSVENLLALGGWPVAWGAAPDWKTELAAYAPYVSLNRLRQRIDVALRSMDLARFARPQAGRPLRTRADTREFILRSQNEIVGLHLADEFAREAEAFERVLEEDLLRAHAWLDGKCLLDLALRRTGGSADQCRAAWCEHVAAAGGVSIVKDRWAVITA